MVAPSQPAQLTLVRLCCFCGRCGEERGRGDQFCSCGATRPSDGWVEAHEAPPRALVRGIFGEDYRIDAIASRRAALRHFRVTRLADQQKVELYVLLEVTEQDAERIRLEARAAAGLSHPGVRSLLDHRWGEGPVLGLILPADAPDNLASLLGMGPTSVSRVVSMMLQLADALCALHALGLVHATLVPEDVMWDVDSDTWTIPGVPWVTGHLAGRTPDGWAAPELALGHRGPAADQYTLGVMAFRALTGVLPHAMDATPEERLAAVPPEVVPPEEAAPAGLRHLVTTLLAPRPEDRYPDMRAVAEALQELVPKPAVAAAAAVSTPAPAIRRPVVAAGPLPPPPPPPAARRGSPIVLLAATGTGLLLALLVLVGWAVIVVATRGPEPPPALPTVQRPVLAPEPVAAPPSPEIEPASEVVDPEAADDGSVDATEVTPLPTATARPAPPAPAPRPSVPAVDRTPKRPAAAASTPPPPASPPEARIEVARPKPAPESTAATPTPAPVPVAPVVTAPAPPEPPAEVPASALLSGRWVGRALDRPVELDLRLNAGGTLTGESRRMVGPRKLVSPLKGRWNDAGGGEAEILASETEGERPAVYRGRIAPQGAVGKVEVGGKARGDFELTRL